MASSMSVFVAYLLVACLIGAQLASARGERLGSSLDVDKGKLGGHMVDLLRMSIRDMYAHSAQMLRQELSQNLAMVDRALRGDMGTVKRNASPPGTTSLGSGPLYFLTRGLELIGQTSTTFDLNVERNERQFEEQGK